jgi:hypothetical protein
LHDLHRLTLLVSVALGTPPAVKSAQARQQACKPGALMKQEAAIDKDAAVRVRTDLRATRRRYATSAHPSGLQGMPLGLRDLGTRPGSRMILPLPRRFGALAVAAHVETGPAAANPDRRDMLTEQLIGEGRQIP